MVFGESFIASCVEITTPYSNLAKVSKYIVECCSHEKKKKYLAELNTRCRSLYQRPGLGQSGLSQYGSQMCQYPWLLNNRWAHKLYLKYFHNELISIIHNTIKWHIIHTFMTIVQSSLNKCTVHLWKYMNLNMIIHRCSYIVMYGCAA